ncbi:MAG: YraN family protein, partial [Bryobacteraceae bacterium]
LGPLWRTSDRLRNGFLRSRVTPNAATGREGEDLAHRYLRKKGFRIVARNWRRQSGAGEVDLIGWDGEDLVFVEVKTRHSSEFGPPERAINVDKEDALLWSAHEYTRRAWIDWAKVRFDLVTVVLGNPPEIVHYERAMKG